MSHAILCDNCRKARTEATELAGWFHLCRLAGDAPRHPLLAMLTGQQPDTAQPPAPPVDRDGVHLCSDRCLMAYVENGLRGLEIPA